MNKLFENLKSLGRARLAALGATTLGILVLAGWLVAQVSSTPMGILYAGLDSPEAGKVVSRLEEMRVPYVIDAAGTTISVPSDQAARTRMLLALEGLPSVGGGGYELLDVQNPMGMTSFMQKIQHLRALEGELARTIRTLDGVKDARVHIVLPERQTFSREAPPATASASVSMKGGRRLDQKQALSIRLLVAAAVPQMKQNSVTVLDSEGVVLAADGNDTAAALNMASDMQKAQEGKIAHAVEEMLAAYVGSGKVRATVSAEMDMNREVVRAQTFDPDAQVVRSTQTVEERSNENEPVPTVTASNNLPNQQTPNPNAQRNNQRTEETVNYEVSSVLKETVKEAGSLKKISVAVLVDGTYNPEGVYTPRSDQEIERITNLVKSAIGYSESRGDQVSIENLRFFTAPPEPIPEQTITELVSENASIIQWLTALLAIILLGLFVIRPIVMRAMEQDKAEEEENVQDLINGPKPGLLPADTEKDEFEEMIDLRSVEARVRASSVRRLAEIVDKHPDETIQIMRAWMYEDEEK